MVAQQTSDVYGKVKAMGAVATWTLDTAEAAVASVGHVAQQAATKLPSGPIEAVDHALCSGLTLLEDKLPLVKEQPAEVKILPLSPLL